MISDTSFSRQDLKTLCLETHFHLFGLTVCPYLRIDIKNENYCKVSYLPKPS